MKIEQIISLLPSALGVLSVLFAGLFENKRAKEIQERIGKNTELLGKFKPEDTIYKKLEAKILQDIERLEE